VKNVIFKTCLQILEITGNYKKKMSKEVLSSGYIKDSSDAEMASICRKRKHPQPSNANNERNPLMQTCKLFLQTAGKKYNLYSSR
jgi:hypothetical protein